MKQMFLCCTEILILFLVIGSSVATAPEQALKITKSGPHSTYSFVGENITYTYIVTNPTDVKIKNVTINDSLINDPVLRPNADLGPGDNIKVQANYTITQADINYGSVSNSANAIGYYQEGVCQSNDVTAIVYVFQSPSLSITKIANLTNYSTVGQNIAYTYTVKNAGNVDIKEPIIVEDDKFGTIFIQSIGILSPGSSAQNRYIYKITEADIYAGSVNTSAYAKSSFNNQPITSLKAVALVRYEHPQEHPQEHPLEHFQECPQDYPQEHPYDERDIGLNYSGAFVPIPMMYDGPRYGSESYWPGSELYGHGSEPPGITEVSNSESHSCKAKVSSSKGSKVKLNGPKAKACLSKHKHKNHSKHHKAEKKSSSVN